jgi:gliding motility-associated-like protein
MKLRYSFLTFFALLIVCQHSSAQLVGDQIFLQGRFLEVGVAPNGAWGNTMPVPATYHSHSGSFPSYPDPITGTSAGSNGLDFSYDPGHDGWTVGSPAPASGNCCFYGAYFLPGTPFDGWSIQMNGQRSDAFYTSSGFALGTGATFSGTNVGYGYTAANPCGPYLESTAAGYWAGTYSVGGGTVSIRSVNRVDTNASWDLVNVTFKNTGATTITGLYYMATADPDNDVTIAGSYPTNNHISYQDDAQHRVEVNARPPSAHQDAFSGLATKDCRAKALIYQSWPPSLTPGNSLSNMYAGTATGIGTATYSLYGNTFTQDIAYGLIFKLGDLAPGDSTRISFAWIFSDTAAIDSAFPQPQLIANCTAVPNIATVSPCPQTTMPVNIAHGEWGTTNWKWSPAIGLASTTGITNSVNVLALTGPTTYTITGTDTSSCNHFQFLLTVINCFSATSNTPGPPGPTICVTDTVHLDAHGDSTGASYIWRGPGVGGPVVGTGQFIIRTGLSMADTGWYYVIKTVGSSHDTTKAHVMLKPLPIINATSNAPICTGSTLNLFSNPDSLGETWFWTGPLGFSSTLSDPTRPSAITAFSGVYLVRATFKGCTDSAYVNVVIDSTPETPTASTNSPVCTGKTLLLTASDPTAGVTWTWAGPNGFTSGVQNPGIPNVHTPAAGVYTVTAHLGVCTATVTTTAVIDSTPIAPALTSNSPVCSGNPLNLTATTLAGSTYHWSGPNVFSTTIQNPTINPATTLASGIYSVYATKAGCISDTATIVVVVDSTPVVPVASSNSPGPPGVAICEGDTLKLFSSSATAGVTYYWTGPLSFTSTLQNPIIPNVTPGATGLYQVTVSLGAACSTSAIISVTITPTPPLTASSNSPVCSGDTLKLTTVASPGSTFSWEGPYTFFSTAPNPIRTPALTEFSGVYTVTVTLNNCKNMVRDTVLVNRTPEPPGLVWLNYCQYSAVPPLQAHGDLMSTILWYPNSVAGTVGSIVPPIPPTANDTVMWFYATQTVNNCISAIDSMKVTVKPTDTVTASLPQRVCPHDTVLLVAVSADGAGSFHWYPPLYLSDTMGAIVTARPETNVTYTVVLTNSYGCTDTAHAIVTVRPNGTMYLKDSVTIFPGESYQLEPQTNCTSFTWFPPSGLSNPFISNPLATPEVNTKYIVMGYTAEGCILKDSINIYVSMESLLAVPNAFIPGSIGPNSTFKVLKRGEAVLNYFRVFDRWGVLVFETNDIDKGWDGKYKEVPQPFGVYVYDIQAVTNTGRVFTKTGNVTLLR